MTHIMLANNIINATASVHFTISINSQSENRVDSRKVREINWHMENVTRRLEQGPD